MALRTYRTKRDFTLTSEPKGASVKRGTGRDFVIQKHAARRLHYDLRLELGGVMKSWAVTRGPSLVPGEKRLAVQVEDHPIEYNTFEGTIPQGQYGGGTVLIWDRGTWQPDGDAEKGLKKGHLAFSLDGEKLHGAWHLIRLRGRDDDRGKSNWLLVKSHDEAERTEGDPDILEEKPRSVVTNRSIEDIAAGKGGQRIWNSNRGAKDNATAGAPTVQKTTKAPAKTSPRRGAASARAKKSASSGPNKKKTKSGAKKKGKRDGTPLPDFVPPCLATLHEQPPTGGPWIHEIKFDGYRMQARLDGDECRLLTRRGLDWTERFQPIADAVAQLGADHALIDGEIVVEEAGVANFSSLQADLSAGRTDRFIYYVFDLLHLNGRDLTGEPLAERKRGLRDLLGSDDRAGRIRFSESFEEDGPALLKHACELKLEGIVSKRRDATYHSGRRDDWIKSKCSGRQEFIVAGYGPSTVTSKGVGSLVLAFHEDGELHYAGRVGTGFTQASAADMWRRLEPLRTEKIPFAIKPPGEKGRKVRWVTPNVVVEVDFRGWTADRIVRHASFQGLREDKKPEEIVREMADRKKEPATGKKATAPKRAPPAKSGTAGKKKSPGLSDDIHLTHPDRIYWPDVGFTKQQLAEFYAGIWDWISPHLVGRPLSLVRCPGGVGSECFFQKHASAGLDARQLAKVPKGADYLALSDLPGLLALVQAGVLEIHTWGSTVAAIDLCDRLVFDLDPGPGVDLAAVIHAAREVRERMAAIGLESFIKTSGGKGWHVVVPIKGTDWDEAKEFTHRIALAMEADLPDRYTSNMAKRTRTGRIFVDYLRNGRGATAVCAYSTRARPGAAVSTPIRWEELGPKLKPDQFTVFNLPQRLTRLRRDPWDGIDRAASPIPKSTAR